MQLGERPHQPGRRQCLCEGERHPLIERAARVHSLLQQHEFHRGARAATGRSGTCVASQLQSKDHPRLSGVGGLRFHSHRFGKFRLYGSCCRLYQRLPGNPLAGEHLDNGDGQLLQWNLYRQFWRVCDWNDHCLFGLSARSAARHDAKMARCGPRGRRDHQILE